MRKFIGLMILVGCLSEAAIAGQIYGNLKQDGRSLRNAQVSIYCGVKPAKPEDVKPTVFTDDNGAYSIHVPQSGKCQMIVQSGGKLVEHAVFSSQQPTRYDFDLIWNGNSLILKRR